jgi:DNA-binding beta-propeller fold protein YncE
VGGEAPREPPPSPFSLFVTEHLRYPRAIACSEDGDVYVVDKEGMVRRFGPDGGLVAEVRVPRIERGTPTGLTLDPRGRLLVTDSHESRILIYDAALELLGTWGERGREPGKLMLVTGIAAASDGRVYVTEEGDGISRVQIFTAEGEHLSTFGHYGVGPGELRRPMAVALDESRGRLAVADAINHRVQLFDLEGSHLAIWGELGEAPGQLKHPYDVAFDPQGRLWIADFGNHRLQVFSAEGQPLSGWGKPGRAPGSLSFPWGLALGPAGTLFLLDSGQDRIYRLARGPLLAR